MNHQLFTLLNGTYNYSGDSCYIIGWMETHNLHVNITVKMISFINFHDLNPVDIFYSRKKNWKMTGAQFLLMTRTPPSIFFFFFLINL